MEELQKLEIPSIRYVSRIFMAPDYSRRFHFDKGNELLHIIEGAVTLKLESGEEYHAGKNESLFVPHHLPHKDIFNIKSGLEVLYINFEWDQADAFFKEASPDFFQHQPEKIRNEVSLIFEMFRLGRHKTPADKLLASGRLAHVLSLGIHCLRKEKAREDEEEESLFSRLCILAQNYMQAHLAEKLDLERVAGYCHVSVSTLTRAFRVSSQRSFCQYLTSLRMQKAKVLLREQALNLADCARMCGYSDAAYFSKCYKKYFGSSPRKG